MLGRKKLAIRLKASPTAISHRLCNLRKNGLLPKEAPKFALMKNRKAALLEMPVGAVKPAPTSELCLALYRYTNKGCSYDAEFNKKIRAKQPDWF